MAETEPYLEHIESKEIRKLVHRLYQEQPDTSINKKEDMTTPSNHKEPSSLTYNDTSFDQIASEIDKILESTNSLEKHGEPTESPLPEFPATEKPKKVEKPERPDKKRGFFGFFKK